MLIKEAQEIAGKLTKTTKLDCKSYGLPAPHCRTGSILRSHVKTVCNKCYACKGRYILFKEIKDAQMKRLRSITNPKWVKAMVTLISKQCSNLGYFRWHDSGDIQSMKHLLKIVKIAKQLPHIQFIIPTKEYAIVRKYFKYRTIPDNLIIRVSAPLLGQTPLKEFEYTITVGYEKGFQCPAYHRGGKCNGCTACWDKSINNINYSFH